MIFRSKKFFIRLLSFSFLFSLTTSPAIFGSSLMSNPNDGGVFICEDNGEEGPMFYPADYSSEITGEPNYSTQNSYTFSSMNYSNAHKYYRGDSVKVAVIDSGLNYTHEDFIDTNSNQIIQGNSRTIDNSSGSWLYYQFSSGYQSKIVDSLGHGTNVASVIASQINSLGCAGIAPNVELYVYKVTNTSNGYEWTAINSALSYCISEGIDVINMSFQAYEHSVTYNGSTMGASTGCSTVMTTYLNNCYNAGITLVAAAGNYNASEPSYPASNNHVISVGSLAESSTTTKAGYSNTYGIDLVAPGTVYVADKGTNSSYKKTSGTSFSAPIVTAAIALYKQQHPTATPAEIESALYASCDSINGNPVWAGNGRLNIDKFLGVDVSDGPVEIVLNNPEIVDETLELQVGDTFDLDWTVNGIGTFDDSVEFENLDTDVLTVDSNGRITAVGEGSDIIAIKSTVDSSVSYDLIVNVSKSAAPVVLDSISLSGQTTEYNVGDTFTFTGTCTAHYSDGSSSPVTPTSVSSPDMSSVGQKTINVSYSENAVTKNASYTITVTASGGGGEEGSQRISSSTSSTYYQSGDICPTGSTSSATATCDAFDVSWLKNGGSNSIAYTYAEIRVYASHSFTITPKEGYTITSVVITANSSSYANAVGGSSVTNCSKSVSGSTVTLTPTNGNNAVGFTNSAQSRLNYIVVNYEYDGESKPTLTSISLSNITTSYVEGDPFVKPTVTAHYSDSSSEVVTNDSSFTGYDMNSLGEQTVTVTYSGETESYKITVNEGTLSSIAVTGMTTTYVKNATFSFDGTCTATFANGYQKVVTPTSVTSPDMSIGGNKTITVSYTYNGNTRTVTYDITVNSSRVVIEETTTTGYSVVGTITWPSNTQTISSSLLSISTSGYTTIESNAIRLGSGSNTGTVTVTATSSLITKVVVSAKTYGSDTGVTLTVGGTSNTITSSYANYAKEYATATNSVAIATTTSKKRAYIESITVYETKTSTIQTDISSSEDCLGLESFIDTYMHMDYVENLGYCSDSEHHYYSTAKTAFNALNTHQRSLFTSNSAYLTEWTRLSTWASKNGDSLNSNNQLSKGTTANPISIINGKSDTVTVVIIVSIFALGFASVAGYYFFSKRKKQN